MADQEQQGTNGFSETHTPPPEQTPMPEPGPRAEERPAEVTAPAPTPEGDDANWHVEAGRKGGRRFHELIQRGLQYEQEHNLKRGRQRLRQLIQEGRLYEQEHGLAPKRRRRGGGQRMRSDQLLQAFCRLLSRIAKPNHREKIARMIQALDSDSPD